MQTRRIGRFEVSAVGLGCNNFGMRLDAEGTNAVVGAALDAGITYFDTADVYGGDGRSEELLGAALGARRDEVVLATKFGMGGMPEGVGGGDPSWVRQACEASLRRLGTDRIDHYQLHQPDPTTPLADTMGALDELVREGKVLEVGWSNATAEGIDEAAALAADRGLAPFVSVQNRYSVMTRDPETGGVLDACRRHGVALVPFFPLESGLLTGKYAGGAPEGSRLSVPRFAERFLDDDRLATVARLTEVATAHGRSILELAISWLVGVDGVASVICGATRPEQIDQNVAAAGWSIDPDTRAEIDRIVTA
ncbi:MAG: aldo/keto reductase [Actinomycetota bacterium]|nr:aldo/keto reductase [Actinomycetota bacterium]